MLHVTSSPKKLGTVSRRAMAKARESFLDIGAGAGRHASYLQNNGVEVTALDLSPGAVEVCRRRGSGAQHRAGSRDSRISQAESVARASARPYNAPGTSRSKYNALV